MPICSGRLRRLRGADEGLGLRALTSRCVWCMQPHLPPDPAIATSCLVEMCLGVVLELLRFQSR